MCGNAFGHCRTLTSSWGNDDTEELIEILGKYNIKATFFVVGEWVDKYPESVKTLFDAGHEVMNHSDDHAHFTKLSMGQMQENIRRCNDKIEAVTGVRPTLFRPPYGEYDDNVVLATRDLGMEPIQWDVELLAMKAIACAARDCLFLYAVSFRLNLTAKGNPHLFRSL